MRILCHTYKLKVRLCLCAALFGLGLGLVGCNEASSSIEEHNAVVELETSERSQSTDETDMFIPLFEGNIAERAAALGEEPHKIGTPINGYASEYIKEAFDNYNFDIEYTSESIAQEKSARDICDFVKVALFSDKIDLSEFYWHHPNTKGELIKKTGSHTYRLTDSDEFFVFFNYFPYEPGYHERNEIEDKLAVKFANAQLKKPQIDICNLGQDPILHDLEGEGAVQKNIQVNNGKCASDPVKKILYELECNNDKHYDVGRAYGDSQSDIGFFIFENHIYVVKIRPFFRIHWWGERDSQNPAMIKPQIVVERLPYNHIPEFSGRSRVCSYHADGGFDK